MNYLVTIGLEIHTTVNSKRKMFSAAPNLANADPNTCIDYIDLGLPGTLPVVNLTVVEKAILLGHALKMQINYQKINFDRKNYFYYDLPKGYQITQYYHPIAKHGKIILPESQKTVEIVQIQIEEDTAKQTKVGDKILLDFNRAGTPLLEIVTAPNFTNAIQVLEFLKYLKRTLVFLGISDGKIELGNLRVDVNLSVRKNATDPYGNKVEIKNIGSFTAVASAINYEITRQTNLIKNGQSVEQQTRRWNETTETTEFMRVKSDAVEYFFIPEPNIPEFGISEERYQELITNSPQNWLSIETDLLTAGLSQKEVDHLLDNYEIYQIVHLLNQHLNDFKKSYKWIGNEILGYLNKADLNFETLAPTILQELIAAVLAVEIEQKLNAKQIKLVFSAILAEGLNLDTAIEKYNLKQITDLNFLVELAEKILEENRSKIDQFLDNPIKFEKFIIGQIMARTKAQANPLKAKEAYLKVGAPLLKQ
ncbi:aspartyl-tRNA(Asn)/glutamyl-tRNA(Gln) amidotransferase subunit B [Mycoplasmoides fastidiosum]|uniref:Aspartyl/glutamyl-tRNA(Asn/Gln) amidotransferase subunit B n=1 Tax=Mycoplasmoides fastidiosum TaxID=92758 RepID=A0ABU0LZD5_9BACT|nr:Asp-tRNA(Asn)/Glu-tRNA(Gln) amidotransferase subunit GatB [Mycoplasmoides fastidiosum]MDQ0514074.1 aspartyl-tRNA(Asn)/glutamyl-tRNA(Gln) amidotransferase subunit B [Mycoplasmoides fastidiosum]UUD37516.1 Asp-tRNA(Asn)/Glu-tRNA(Gln) amidotransferase subunit GatB [Mycoplasmoides fastidiosum]